MTTKTIASTMLALILFAIFTTEAQARRHVAAQDTAAFDRHNPTGQVSIQRNTVREIHRTKSRPIRKQMREPWDKHRRYAKGSHETRIVAHPPGCPSRAFCGCGVALDVFKKHVRDLWLARNWFRFPSATPAPGMVAVRRHHVYVIRAMLGNNMVLAYDPNSGGHKTRIHPRSLAGYRVVNPHGGRYAKL